MNILFVPLDDRPCTMRFPSQLSKLVSFNLILPPRELLGSYLTPGQPRKLLQWLKGEAGEADAAILSLDMLIHGGLIASRALQKSETEIAGNLGALERFLQEKPFKNIYAFNVIMRNTPTYTSPGILKELPRFLKMVNRLYELSIKEPEKLEEHITKAKSTLTGEISGERYFYARKRNHEINKKAVSWQKNRYIDSLILGMDDVVTKGLNLYEKKLLEEIIGHDTEDEIFLYPGTDEMAMMLLARLACKTFGCKPSFALRYSSSRGKNATPLYEDRSVHDLIRTYISMLDGEILEAEPMADIVLCVHLFPGGQKEAVWQHLVKSGKRQKISFVKKIRELLYSGNLVALADIAYANGADCMLSEALQSHLKIPSLSGYAAWNTAGNTLGTVISQATLRWLSQRFRSSIRDPLLSEKAHQSFIFSRFIDDWMYQSHIRQKIGAYCQKTGVSIFDLGGLHRKIEHIVDGLIFPKAEEMFRKAFEGHYRINSPLSPNATISIGSPFTCQVGLPWPRIFEIDVECDFSLSVKPPR